ncbi:hypothetical protein EVAR_6515_1 [Eumeta japonica]|uniref:Uncharacterized protein n=1 Tax=Eumeta variegata TaxID=151549 RepID=A0A4C1SSV9_EUMVA|nr:hypothetical protein EVAR_6515_1 [Eumeta japonica]
MVNIQFFEVKLECSARGKVAPFGVHGCYIPLSDQRVLILAVALACWVFTLCDNDNTPLHSAISGSLLELQMLLSCDQRDEAIIDAEESNLYSS